MNLFSLRRLSTLRLSRHHHHSLKLIVFFAPSSILLSTMEDIISLQQNCHPTPQHREQFTAAMSVAARKVEKKVKEETPTKMFVRINAAKVVKENKSVKTAAKKLLKKKKLKKISTFFVKK
jgi:hypothetical protein